MIYYEETARSDSSCQKKCLLVVFELRLSFRLVFASSSLYKTSILKFTRHAPHHSSIVFKFTKIFSPSGASPEKRKTLSAESIHSGEERKLAPQNPRKVGGNFLIIFPSPYIMWVMFVFIAFDSTSSRSVFAQKVSIRKQTFSGVPKLDASDSHLDYWILRHNLMIISMMFVANNWFNLLCSDVPLSSSHSSLKANLNLLPRWKLLIVSDGKFDMKYSFVPKKKFFAIIRNFNVLEEALNAVRDTNVKVSSCRYRSERTFTSYVNVVIASHRLYLTMCDYSFWILSSIKAVGTKLYIVFLKFDRIQRIREL